MAKNGDHPALFFQALPESLKKGDRRKVEIVEGAIRCLASQGLSHFTFESIGKECQIAKSHVAYHFPALEDLLLTAVHYVYTVGQRTVTAYLEAETNPRKRLQAYLHGSCAWHAEHPDHGAVTTLLGYLSTLDPRYRKIQTEVKAIGLRRLMAILRDQGVRRPPRELRLLADAVQSLIIAKLLYFVATGPRRDLKGLQKETWQAVQLLLPASV